MKGTLSIRLTKGIITIVLITTLISMPITSFLKHWWPNFSETSGLPGTRPRVVILPSLLTALPSENNFGIKKEASRLPLQIFFRGILCRKQKSLAQSLPLTKYARYPFVLSDLILRGSLEN